MMTLSQSKIRYKGIVGILFCTLVASVDETIQLFAGGRMGQITDVYLDSTGALAGILLFYLCLLIFLRH